MALVAVCAVVALAALLATRRISSHDLGFHLAAGRSMLEGHGWPRLDTFTYTLSHRPYIDTSWGYQIVLAALERVGGAGAIVAFHVVLVVLTFALVARSAWSMASGSPWIAPLLLAGVLAAEPRFESRPELWSWLALALLVDRLHAYTRRGAALWPIVPLFLVWANSHSLFIVGWVALACFLAGRAFASRAWDRRLLASSALAVAVTLVNPYGWRAPLFAAGLSSRFSGANAFAQTIGEFRSPFALLASDELQFYLPSTVGWLAFTAAVIASIAGLWKLRSASALALIAAGLFLSLSMVRNVPLFVVVGLPSAVSGLAASGARDRRPWRALATATELAVLVVAAAVGLRVVTDAFYVDARRQQRFGLGWNAIVLPVELADWAERADPPERVLNHLAFGGYLMWARAAPVFIDSRLEVVGEEFFGTYLAALASRAGLDEVTTRYGVGWIALPYRLRPDTTLGLSNHPQWRLAYVDAVGAAFVRRDLASEGMIDRSALEAERPETGGLELGALPGWGGRPRAGGLRYWGEGFLGRRRYPDEAFNSGVFHHLRNEPLAAARQFARAIEQSRGAHYEVYGNLGASLAAIGRLEDARVCFEIVLDELPWYRVERERLTREQLAEVERALSLNNFNN